MASIIRNLSSTFRGIAKKFAPNPIIVSRAKQFSGEVAFELPFTRFYDYYHGWPEVKRGLNGIHRRLMGTDISYESDDDAFTKLFIKWAKVVGLRSKFEETVRDMLITGTFNLAEEFTPDNHLGNVKHVPMSTMWKAFRDDFGNVLEIVQMIDGQLHRLSPDYMIHYAINNPEEEYFGKSEIFSIAVPQKVTGDFDQDGNLIEADKYLVSVLDRDARIRFSQLATAEKHAKSMMFVQVKGETDKKRIKEIEDNINSSDTRKFITLSDKEFVVQKAQPDISSVMKDYTDDMKQQIAKATNFPSEAIDNPGSAGFAASQTPIQEMMAQVAGIQKDLEDLMVNTIMKRKCEDWGFDFYETNPRWTFSAFVEKIVFEQYIKLEPSTRISDMEFRAGLKQFVPDLNDDEFLEWKDKRKEEAMALPEPGVTPGNSPGKDEGTPERPDIEKEAPKPDTTSAEVFPKNPLTNPKVMESYVKSLIQKDKALENFAQVLFKSTFGTKFETMPPGITEEDVEEALNAINDGVSAQEVFTAFKKKATEANTFGDLEAEMNPAEIGKQDKVETRHQDITEIPRGNDKKKVLRDVKNRKKTVEEIFTRTDGQGNLD